jgi:hypothetical protein
MTLAHLDEEIARAKRTYEDARASLGAGEDSRYTDDGLHAGYLRGRLTGLRLARELVQRETT